MKRILLMSLLAISTALSAQKPVELELWPDGVPNSNGITTPEQKLENNRISNVSEPTLTVLSGSKALKPERDLRARPWLVPRGDTYAWQ